MSAIPSPHAAHRAFTLIELLVCIGVIAVLVGILAPALASARNTARMSRELSAGQQLITAYTLYADDAKGFLLPGYVPPKWVDPNQPLGTPLVSAMDETGERVLGVPAQRYPWRILPYVDYNFSGLYKDESVLRRYRERDDFRYVVSLSPSFALNSTFCGGDYDRFGFNDLALRTWGPFYLSRLDQAQRPAQVIAFVTARGVNPDGDESLPGYFRADPPNTRVRVWQTTPPESMPEALPGQYGNVDYRYANKAAALQLDGHAELSTFKALDDMRRWSDRAGRADWMIGN